MKHSSRLLILLLFVTVLYVCTIRASSLPSQPKLGVDDAAFLASNVFSWELMELEKCEEEDDECLKRRMTSEAHLDYIYTQRHEP